MLIIRSNLYLRDLDRDNCVILDSIGSDPWEQCEGGGRGGQTACPQPITCQAAQARPAFRPDHNMSVPRHHHHIISVHCGKLGDKYKNRRLCYLTIPISQCSFLRLDKDAQTSKSFANCKEILISHIKLVSKQKNESIIIIIIIISFKAQAPG